MLTANQETFCQSIVQGMTQADAYRTAYSCKRMSNNAIYRDASLLAANPKIAQRIKELRDQIAQHSIMTAQERLEFLTQVVNGTKGEKVMTESGEEIEVPASMKNRLSAVDIMNKMTGEYELKIKGNVNITKLEDLI